MINAIKVSMLAECPTSVEATGVLQRLPGEIKKLPRCAEGRRDVNGGPVHDKLRNQ